MRLGYATSASTPAAARASNGQARVLMLLLTCRTPLSAEEIASKTGASSTLVACCAGTTPAGRRQRYLASSTGLDSCRRGTVPRHAGLLASHWIRHLSLFFNLHGGDLGFSCAFCQCARRVGVREHGLRMIMCSH